MKRSIYLLIACTIMISMSCSNEPVTNIDLSGEWRFASDPQDTGITEGWFSRELPEVVNLPGSMTTNGKGNEVDIQTKWTGQVVDSSFYHHPKYAKFREPGNFKVPFWLQPVKHYVGAAWYQREIEIPNDWDGRHIELFLERCHWESKLWVNGTEAGMRNSLGTPHIFEVTQYLKPGKNTITLCVDNRTKEIDPGINAHSISDHTQSNWNGIVGKLYLESRPLVHIRSIRVYPDVAQKKAVVRLDVSNPEGKATKVNLELSASGATTPAKLKKEFTLEGKDNILRLDYPLGDQPALWDEFEPNLYTLQAVLKEGGNTDTKSTTFGMREFEADGRQLTINGRPVFLRGTLECAIFPKTGYPPTDVESWTKIIEICQAHGLNHMRFHSWCPPKAAFEAADLAGFYFQAEASSWPNQSTTLGDGKPFDQYLYEETERMMEQYGNHPSFIMMAHGNEPGGPKHRDFLTRYVSHWKLEDPRRLYVSGAGWPNIPENDFMNDPAPRIQAWGAGLNSIINREAPRSDYDWSEYISRFPQPVVSHEIGQWCVYPNFREIEKYDGVLKARNFEIFREILNDNGMAHLADSFLLASGKLQALCYKADIEAALRTKQFGGFQLLDLHDFPGQGTALVGVLDAFWGEKGYITPEEFSMFCNSTVPLARLPKHVYTNNETFEVPVEIAHFGQSALVSVTPGWKISGKGGQVIGEGKFTTTDIPIGNAFQLGEISLPLQQVTSPQHLTLEVSANNFSNSWDFWVYPEKKEEITGAGQIRVVQKPDASTLKFLEEGGTVLLHLQKGTLSADMGGNIPIGFSSIFWNTAWTRGQAPHSLGILCNPDHPALADFPTQYHSNWQWWDAMSHSGAINLTTLPAELKPVVRVIDDWFTNRPLALIIEAKVGNGKLLVSGIDFSNNMENRPEAQQLLHSLTKYMAGGQFNPSTALSADQIKNLIQ
jgi:hypothetical protein